MTGTAAGRSHPSKKRPDAIEPESRSSAAKERKAHRGAESGMDGSGKTSTRSVILPEACLCALCALSWPFHFGVRVEPELRGGQQPPARGAAFRPQKRAPVSGSFSALLLPGLSAASTPRPSHRLRFIRVLCCGVRIENFSASRNKKGHPFGCPLRARS